MNREEERALRCDSILRTLAVHGNVGWDTMERALVRAYPGLSQRTAREYIQTVTAIQFWARSKGGILSLTEKGQERLRELDAVQTKLDLTEEVA